MKIVVISNVTGGLFSFRRELLELLTKENEVIILSWDTGRLPELLDMGCQFVSVEMDRHGKNFLKELELVRTYKRHLKEIQPDIVLTYTIKPNIYAGMACAALKIPYVENITGLGTAVENGGILQKVTLFLYRRGLRNAQKVFFQNAENMKFMVDRGIVSGDYELIPGSGVNLERYTVLPYPEGQEIHFVFMSRIIKEKGIDQYLAAARYIGKKYPNTRFHICGKCSEAYEKVMEEAEKDGILYHGKIEDVIGMHRISSCTIHPTYYPEGLSNVLLESAACARPIITTDRAGCREVIDEGVNGFVVKQKDSEDLIEKVEKFLALSNEERKQMGLRGREKVEKEFDRNVVIRKYMAELDKVRGRS